MHLLLLAFLALAGSVGAAKIVIKGALTLTIEGAQGYLDTSVGCRCGTKKAQR